RLIVVVLVCGVGFAAFRSPSNLWATTLYSAAFGVLVMGIVNLVVRKQRAYWVGFGVCGWAYMATVFGPWANEGGGQRLATTAMLDVLYPHFASKDAEPVGVLQIQTPDVLRRLLIDESRTATGPSDEDRMKSIQRRLDMLRVGPTSSVRWAAWTAT